MFVWFMVFGICRRGCRLDDLWCWGLVVFVFWPYTFAAVSGFFSSLVVMCFLLVMLFVFVGDLAAVSLKLFVWVGVWVVTLGFGWLVSLPAVGVGW